MTRPVLIKKIYDSRGNAIYQNSYAPMQRSMAPETAAFLDEMMRETVKSGTARKAFAGYRRDSVLSELVIGGKTGTIDSRDHDIRYDWFCGFARERDGNRKIAVAVLTGHKKPHLDTRSSTHARYIIKEAFRKYISRKSASRAKNRTRARSTDRG
jgi:membrane peptidoglycan carboxypeptidase